MKTQNAIVFGIGTTVLLTVLAWKINGEIKGSNFRNTEKALASNSIEEKPCVFMSLMGEQSVEGYANTNTENIYAKKIEEGEKWIVAAQNKDGGWGAGSHSNQKEMNPQAVSSDPATTAMTAMALYRCGYAIDGGKYSETLKNALSFLLNEIENNKNEAYITKIRDTQIQRKLGENIDAVLALQFLNQV